MAGVTVNEDDIQAIIDSGEVGVGQAIDEYDNAFAFYIAAVDSREPTITVGADTGTSR